ncbi:MAG: PAS domain-containing protein, partial [Oceanidesulfovibrio sp.]
MLLFDGDGKVLAANPSARDLFGGEGEIAGREATSLFDGDGGRRFMCEIQGGADRPTSLEAVSCKDADGNGVQANLRLTPAKLSGSTCYQVFVDAQHDSGSLEQQLLRKRRELDEMTITLKNVMETVTRDKRQLKSEMARQIEVELFP